MTELFGHDYSDLYDLMYKDKGYVAECDLIESRLAAYSPHSVSTILDLGCGTGGHVLELIKRGYRVTGVDRSSEMLRHARAKFGGDDVPRFVESSIQDLSLDENFDAAVMMFAVLGYQLTNEDALSALRATREHLKDGAVLLFDLWYGPAVIAIGPDERVVEIEVEGGRLVKSSAAALSLEDQIARVQMSLRYERAGTETRSAAEEHAMRFFFPNEIDLLLRATGFEHVHTASFPDGDTPAGLDTWNVLVTARAR